MAAAAAFADDDTENIAAANTELERGMAGAGIVAHPEEVAMVMDSPWADLPRDLIIMVVSLLPPCHAQRLPAAGVNKHWRQVVDSGMFMQAYLPWLVLLSTENPLIHSTETGEWHQLLLPEQIRKHARICGSFEGGWMVLSMENEPLQHQIYNLNGGKSVELPVFIMADGQLRPVKLLAAVLSGAPVAPYSVTAIAEVNSTSSCLAVWKHGDPHWVHMASCDDQENLEDILQSKEGVYFISSEERLGLLLPCGEVMYLQIRERSDYWLDQQLSTVKHYLCESQNGQILMIVKLEKDLLLELKVYKLMLQDEVVLKKEDSLQNDNNKSRWLDVSEQLQDHVFVGTASSRSFKAKEEPKVHYFDDRYSHFLGAPGYFMRDDMGLVSLDSTGQITNWPELGDPPLPPPISDRCPPGWWLHEK